MRVRSALWMVLIALALGSVPLRAQPGGPFQFHSLTPCRLIDTRDGSGASNEAAGPRVNPGPHNFRVQGFCGVPVGAKAATVNVTVIGPTQQGDLRLFPSNVGQPLVAVMSYNALEPALCNGAIVPLAQVGGDDITVLIGMACGVGCGQVHLTMDVTGYFQ